MLRKISLNTVLVKWQSKTADVLRMTRTGFQNYVMSRELAQLERYCERYCLKPRVPTQKVAVIGAGSDVGQVACLFLKQQPVIRTLAMYDDVPERGVLGVANDLAHIDTSTEIQAYQGKKFLKNALEDSDAVLICGGAFSLPPCCETQDQELFLQNQHHVRTVAVAIAKFCPYAVVAVQTPPVDSNFALCMHTLKKEGTYDRRRVLGVNSINSMRANQLFCNIVGQNPGTSTVPVVGGAGRCTRVPVFSAGKAKCFPQTQIDCLTRLVREADEIICKVKSNNEQGHLSIGFSSARFVTNIMKGLFEGRGSIDSALVEQADPDKCYGLKVCSIPVTIGAGGISEYLVPQLSQQEKELLESSKCDLEDMLNLGRCYALGEEYFQHPGKFLPCAPPAPPCRASCNQLKSGRS